MKILIAMLLVVTASVPVEVQPFVDPQCECLYAKWSESPGGGTWMIDLIHSECEDGTCDITVEPCPQTKGCVISAGWSYTHPGGVGVRVLMVQRFPGGTKQTGPYTSGDAMFITIDANCGEEFSASIPGNGDNMKLLCTSCSS